MADTAPMGEGPLRLAGVLRGAVWAVAAVGLPDGTVVAAGDSHGQLAWWDVETGELLGKLQSPDPAVVRSMTSISLPDGRVVFAAGGSRGSILAWNAVTGNAEWTIPLRSGPVWSMAAVTLPGGSTVLFSGEDDGRIHRWDVRTGEPVGAPFGDHAAAVRAMAVGPLVDGRSTLVTGADNGTVRQWDAETGHAIGSVRNHGSGAVWGLAVSTLAMTVSCGNVGTLCRWDETGALLGAPIPVGSGALTGIVTATLTGGDVALICSGVDGRLSCWDAHTGRRMGRPVLAAAGGVLSLAAAPGLGRLVFGGTDGTVTVAATPWNARPAVSVRAQIDSARVEDRLGRRVLAAHLEGLLGQLAAHSDSTSAVVHVDGPWGGGKSTLVKLLLRDEHTHGPSWTPPVVVNYEAWREGAIAPEWWSLAAAVEREVRRSRPWVTRVAMQVWSVVARTLRSPATLVALAVAAGGTLLNTLLPESWMRIAVTVLAAAGGLLGAGLVVGRTLFWHSAPFGRLHLHTEDNPLGQVADMVAWLRRWTPRAGAGRRPVLLVIDDLDRCPADRVVRILETVHTILRQPVRRGRRELARLFVLVLADGRWITKAFTSRYAEFGDPGNQTRDLGSDFAQKVFDHVVHVPDLSRAQLSTYLDDVLAARTAPTTGVKPQPRQQPAPPPAQEQEQLVHARREATAEVLQARGDHLLHTYADLVPPNPRMIKRIANALGMLLAVQIHVRHAEDDDALARAAILLVRFPLLAARLRHDPLDDKDPCWDLSGVRDVLGEHDLTSLARCLGRT
ncbi:P-loop NTPase fold protein [Actinokineospora auranticolor]|uniref:Putative pyrroloquinoline-quinone binding quinoprotein n=1 Tax=Actinokineospora auranticolor TaxID=155976 RepID=A0A2S6GCN0_9PSEU|nr:P-loop NTPase fold protein [Actinokineospora auranticolor]PPK62738.1 putative pyrroloquinoline-quinone binding quinoprotein [Actinokineospora auranticolor]